MAPDLKKFPLTSRRSGQIWWGLNIIYRVNHTKISCDLHNIMVWTRWPINWPVIYSIIPQSVFRITPPARRGFYISVGRPEPAWTSHDLAVTLIAGQARLLFYKPTLQKPVSFKVSETTRRSGWPGPTVGCLPWRPPGATSCKPARPNNLRTLTSIKYLDEYL